MDKEVGHFMRPAYCTGWHYYQGRSGRWGGRRSWEFDRAFHFHSASGVVRLLLEFLEKEVGNDGWMDEA